MSKTNLSNINALIISRLSIERCQGHLAHLHALMHLCGRGRVGVDDRVAESALKIMENIESDLAHSATALSFFE